MKKRTPESEAKYQAVLAGGHKTHFEMEPAISGKWFKYWKIIDNEFPYDAAAKVHHLLVPKRVLAKESECTEEEIEELIELKETVCEEYDTIWQNPFHKKTVPGHFHLHLIKWI